MEIRPPKGACHVVVVKWVHHCTYQNTTSKPPPPAWHPNSTYSTRPTGWFRLNAQNCVPGNSSRRFFELDHEILHTYSGRHYLKLEEGGFLIFCLGGRLFGVPAGVLDPGGGQNPDISTAKPQIKKKPLRVLDTAFQNMCAKFRGLTRKNGVRNSRGHNFGRSI